MEFVEQIVDFFKASPSFKFDYSSNGTGAFIKVDVLSKLLHVLRGGDTAARMFFLWMANIEWTKQEPDVSAQETAGWDQGFYSQLDSSQASSYNNVITCYNLCCLNAVTCYNLLIEAWWLCLGTFTCFIGGTWYSGYLGAVGSSAECCMYNYGVWCQTATIGTQFDNTTTTRSCISSSRRRDFFCMKNEWRNEMKEWMDK